MPPGELVAGAGPLPALIVPGQATKEQQAAIAIDWSLRIIEVYGKTAGDLTSLIEWAKDDEH